MKKIAAAFLLAVFAATAVQAKTQDGGVCPRPAAGSVVARPGDLYSQNNVLNVTLNYQTSVDGAGRTLFCFVTPDGVESPTALTERLLTAMDLKQPIDLIPAKKPVNHADREG